MRTTKQKKQALDYLEKLFTNQLNGITVSKSLPYDKTVLERDIERFGYRDNPNKSNGGGAGLRFLLKALKEERGIQTANIPKKGYYPLTQNSDFDKEWTKHIRKAWGCMKRAELVRQKKLSIIGKDIQFSPDKEVEEAYHKFVRTVLGTVSPDVNEIAKDLDL
jgi:hypothetical protein